MDIGLIDAKLSCTKYTGHAIYPYSWLKIMRNHPLIVWLWWVNDNICEKLGTDKYTTTMVKLRIAISMLYMLSSLTDEEKREIHTNLTDNVHKAIYIRNEEDLPF